MANLHCNAKQGRTGNKQGNSGMKTGLSCNHYRIFFVTGKNRRNLQDNPAFITGFSCWFPFLPRLAFQCKSIAPLNLKKNRNYFIWQINHKLPCQSVLKTWVGLWPCILPLLFLNNNDPIFCNLLFETHIFNLSFSVPGSKKIPGRPDKLKYLYPRCSHYTFE